MVVWTFILEKLKAGKRVMLLYVLTSEGSSPGRQGFKMAIAADGEMMGTIGGGIMEHKLVEKARVMLSQPLASVLLQQQYHDKEKTKDQSGMICSGSQLNAFIPLSAYDRETVEKVIVAQTAVQTEKKTLLLSPRGLQLTHEPATGLQYKTDEDWLYSETVNNRPVIHIIGGGHVGLALSELMHYLDFYIKLYDDRPGLNTMAANSFAHEKQMVNYETIGRLFDHAEQDFVVIATVGYRTDKIVLKQLVNKTFFYIGLLGSDHKIRQLLTEIKDEATAADWLAAVHTPIGINIFSKTPKEIAVSIAAEIIREKNKDLPTGRK